MISLALLPSDRLPLSSETVLSTATLRPVVRAVIASTLREHPAHPDVEDATSETLRRALERGDRMRDVGSARAYVLGIARHVALDVIRARKRERARTEPVEEPSSQRHVPELVTTEPDPYERAVETRRAELVRGAFERLPDGQRRALMMFHLDGLEYQEIAARLNVPLGTVATWVNRGRKAMAAALQNVREP